MSITLTKTDEGLFRFRRTSHIGPSFSYSDPAIDLTTDEARELRQALGRELPVEKVYPRSLVVENEAEDYALWAALEEAQAWDADTPESARDKEQADKLFRRFWPPGYGARKPIADDE